MTLINQPVGTGIVRKVQFATWGATFAGALGSQIAPVPAEFLAYLIANLFEFWRNDTAYLALVTLLQVAIFGMFAGGGAFTGGYMARARVGEFGQ
jgi:hypothetical protein